MGVSINKVRVGEGLLYILLWGAIYMVPLLNAAMTARENLYIQEVILAWSRITPFLLIFIINNNFLAPDLLMRRRRYMKYMLLNISFILIIFSAIGWVQENIVQDRFILDRPDYAPLRLTDLTLFWNAAFALMMVAANGGIKFVYKSIRDEQLMNELRTQNLQVEMEYLKYQINPHFFMNTLNNIHVLIDIDPETAKEAVIDLSKMMRYVLYESGSLSTTLRRDLEFVDNYIELMRIRYAEQVRVETHFTDNLPLETTIPPLLLVVFVENAFKHGVGNNDSYINISIESSDAQLTFVIENSLNNIERASGGIGLVNVRKRLELIYGDQFKLITGPKESSYRVELTIPINHA
ncbi:MAG: histidine kinase [Rikenellaceae bacterium]